jgi:protein tyrosine phosphatase
MIALLTSVCSAGIGRTGTFIALDALYRQGLKDGRIDIVQYVHVMREDRMNMIQNVVGIGPMYMYLVIKIITQGCNALSLCVRYTVG